MVDGDRCPSCGSTLKTYRGIEGGHIFVLGTHYSAKMGCTFLDEEGKDKPVVVYCKSGGRAGKAKQALEAAGFTRVVNGGGYRKLAAQ